MNENIIIKDRVIGNHQSPFLIAEMSGNHNQSIDRGFGIGRCSRRRRSPCNKTTNLYGRYHDNSTQ